MNIYTSLRMSFDGLNQVSHKKNVHAQQMVDFLIEHPQKHNDISHLEKPQKKSPWFNIMILVIIIMALGIGLVATDNLSSKQTWLDKFNPFRAFAGMFTGAGNDNKMTVLALGMGGAGHDGPYLTDTIMVISLDLHNKHVTMLSIPRDMVVKNKEGYWTRINSVYSLGRATSPEQGVKDITSTITEITGLNIDYYAILNFKGFVDLIDAIDGVTVNVENAFTDNTFPTDVGGKVTVVSFFTGEHVMDGVTALRYARSRHGTNGENSDFARSRRQQIIIEAVRQKLLSLNAFNDFDKISKLFTIVKDNFESNASIDTIYKVAKMMIDFDKKNIHNFVITDGPDGLLVPARTAEGAMVLQPKDGNYETLKRMISYMSVIQNITKENQKVAVLNGTDVASLASQTSSLLTSIGFQISQYGNAQEKGFENSVIYKISESDKTTSINVLKQELKAVVAETKPEWLVKWLELHQTDRPDIIAVIGKNYSDSAINTSPLPIPPYIAPTSTATSTPEDIATSTSTATSTTEVILDAGGDSSLSETATSSNSLINN